MDEKKDQSIISEGVTRTDWSEESPNVVTRWRISTDEHKSVVLLACYAVLLAPCIWIINSAVGTYVWKQPQPVLHYEKRTTLEAHIMSKCPDARDCLRDLVIPTMEKVSDKIDFTLSYIGKNIEDDDSVECMHGQSECLGNIIQLCAANLYHDPKIYLGFTMCMLDDYSHIPQKDLVQYCALEHGIDFDKINDCASDAAFGMDLLRNSVARSANANVTTSCTVRLNDKIRCIRDGGEWKDCKGGSEPKDLIHDIKSSQMRLIL